MTTTPSSPRRSPWRKIILGALALGVLAVFTAVGLAWWTESKIERIPDDEISSLVEVDGPRNILIVGTDSREDLPEDFEGNFGNFEGTRTDVIMLVHFIPGERAQILSLPRDLRVDIPGEGFNKINAAHALGGPDLLIQTVVENLEVDVNNYVEIDFAGFANIVDALGGVELEFNRPARDLKSGLEITQTGAQQLNGAQALAFARSRQYEELRDGDWVKIGDNDIARTRRQQKVLLALFDQATAANNALNLPNFAATVAEQIMADESLSIGVLIELGRAAISLESSDLEAMTLPSRIETIDDVSYVVRVDPETDEVLRAFRIGRPFPAS
ncbi:MAG: LCP family protein [Acidimicrobiia bacterium]|nr:LCP family protein [Acidimicrobiia bacterium]